MKFLKKILLFHFLKKKMNFIKSFILLIIILFIIYLLFSPYLHKTKDGFSISQPFHNTQSQNCSLIHDQSSCQKNKNCTWKQQLNHNGKPIMDQGKPKYECSSF